MPNLSSPQQRQLFSVPYNFVLYITENPASPEVLEKLQQTCKYFFTKNPILIIRYLDCRQNKDYVLDYALNNFAIKTNAKFWPTSTLIIRSMIKLQKFHQFSPEKLYIDETELSLKEFDLIVAKNTVIEFGLKNAEIKDTTIDVVFEKLENVAYFYYNNPKEIYSVETLQKLYSTQKNRKLELFKFRISIVSQTFPPSIYVYLKQQTDISEFEFQFLTQSDTSKTEFAETLQRINPNIFKVEIPFFSCYVSVKFL